WRRIPTGRLLRAASCAAATDLARPTVIGNTVPGNSTMFRTGRMMRASAGRSMSGGGADCCWSFIFETSDELAQNDDEAAVHELASCDLVAAGRERQAPLEAAGGDLHPPYGGAPDRGRKSSLAGQNQHPGVDHDFQGIRSDA